MSKEEVEILGRVRSQHLRSETTIAILESKVEELSERLDTLTIDLHTTREAVSPLRQKLDNAKQKILGITKAPGNLDDSLTKLQKRADSPTLSTADSADSLELPMSDNLEEEDYYIDIFDDSDDSLWEELIWHETVLIYLFM